MLVLISAGIAPGLALLSYFYLKDEFEMEPISTVIKAFLYGAVLVFPIMFVQYVFEAEQAIPYVWMKAIVFAGLLEEFMKWFMLYFAIYQHVDFTEPYDGIVYGISVSLGFATAENILFLLANGIEFAFGRALLPVSSHAMFGIIMGYYLGKGKFSNGRKVWWLLLSIVIPFILHSFYDLILLTQTKWLFYIVPFMLFLWWLGLRKAKLAHHLSAKHYLEQTNDPSLRF
jgi:protease PrsW